MAPDHAAPTASCHPDWRRNQVAVTVAVFIGFASFTLVMPFLPLYFEMLGVTDPASIAIWSGVSLGVTPAITALMTPAWARLATRFGHKVMVQRSLFSFVVIMALMAFVREPWQVFALRTIQGFFAGYGPIAMMLAAESAPAEHMAAAIGWVQTSQRLGPALGPVIGGQRSRRALASAARFSCPPRCTWRVSCSSRSDTGREACGGRRRRTAKCPRLDGARLLPHVPLFVAMIFALQLVDRSFGPDPAAIPGGDWHERGPRAAHDRRRVLRRCRHGRGRKSVHRPSPRMAARTVQLVPASRRCSRRWLR